MQHHAEPELVQSLLDMGFPETRARTACILTHNVGIEPAANWLMEHADDPDIDVPVESRREQPGAAAGTPSTSSPVMGVPSDASLVVHPDGLPSSAHVVGVQGECKAVLVVARDLNMSPGKVGAQCAHAAVGLYKELLARRVPWMRVWEDGGQRTIVLGAATNSELQALSAQAAVHGLYPYEVHDAGRTEVAAGSLTVVAMAGLNDAVDAVTGRLTTL